MTQHTQASQTRVFERPEKKQHGFLKPHWIGKNKEKIPFSHSLSLSFKKNYTKRLRSLAGASTSVFRRKTEAHPNTPQSWL